MNISHADSRSVLPPTSVVPLACAAIWARNLGLLATLPANAASELRQRDGLGRDALMYAASVGNREIVQLILRKGAATGSSDSLGNSALHYAVLTGVGGIVADLVQAGAMLDAQNNAGETPLFLATRENNLPVVQYLLEQAADPNVVTAPHEISPLHMATVNADVSLCRVLIKHGAFVNARDDVGETPLHWAACDYEGDPSVIRLLIEEANADIDAQNEDGETPVHHALTAGTQDLVTYLNTRAPHQLVTKSQQLQSSFQQQQPQQQATNSFTAKVY